MKRISRAINSILFLLLAMTSSLSAVGELKWQKTFPESEAPYYVRIDAQGSIYVIGRYYVESPENGEIFVKKLLTDSTVVWSDTSSGVELKLPIAAQLDAEGNVYVLVQYASDNASPTIIYRFNSITGNIDWERSFLPSGNFKQSGARDLVVTSTGYIIACTNYVIDNPAQPSRSDHRAFLVCYNSAGVLQWSREDFIQQPSVAFERLGTTGNTVFVMGEQTNNSDVYNGFVAGYNLSGDSLWFRSSSIGSSGDVFGQGHAVDSLGNFLAIFQGYVETEYLKLASNGGVAFDVTGPLFGFAFKNSIASDLNGNFYWVVNDDLGMQHLQSRGPSGTLVYDSLVGNQPSQYPIVFAPNNTLLSWHSDNRPAEYSLTGKRLWTSAEDYSSLGDIAAFRTGASYWILYEYDQVIPDLLYRRLVKYELGTVCGDVDASGRIDITDAVTLVNYIFAGGMAPRDRSRGDLDCSMRTDISDIVAMINFLFAGGAAPCAACR